jgi:DNA-binding SARP family transcriptional activator
LEVLVGGVPVEVRGSRRRSLLVLLALSPGRAVPVHRITDVLTEGAPDEHAVATVRTYLSKLRTELGPAAGLVRTRDHGYVLAVPDEAVDAHRFRRLVGAARTGSPQRRIEQFGEALALWRGTPLVGIDGRWVPSEAAALVDLRIEAVRGLAEARAALGDGIGAAQLLGDLLREHPTREDVAAALMRELYRTGRQADALMTYARVRDRLARDLGVEPGPALRAAHTAILAHDPVGLQHASLGDRSLRVRASVHVRHPVPTGREGARRLPLAGRDAEVGALMELFRATCTTSAAQVALVTGEAGIGKSRLVREVADGCAVAGATVVVGDAPSGLRAWAGLLPRAPTGELLPREPVEAGQQDPPSPGVPRHVGRTIGNWWRAAAAERPLVVVVEDLEHLDEETATVLRDAVLTAASARVLVLATVREPGPSDGHPVHDLCASLRRHDLLHIVSLVPLEADAVRVLAEARGVEVDVDRLVSDTGGNPFLVTRSLAALAASGRLAASDALAGIEVLVGEWLAALPAATVETLLVAAAVGATVELDLVAAARAADPAVVSDGLAPAVAAGLLREEASGVYRFTHGIVREAALRRLGPTRVALAQRRIALTGHAADVGRSRAAP